MKPIVRYSEPPPLAIAFEDISWGDMFLGRCPTDGGDRLYQRTNGGAMILTFQYAVRVEDGMLTPGHTITVTRYPVRVTVTVERVL